MFCRVRGILVSALASCVFAGTAVPTLGTSIICLILIQIENPVLIFTSTGHRSCNPSWLCLFLLRVLLPCRVVCSCKSAQAALEFLQYEELGLAGAECCLLERCLRCTSGWADTVSSPYSPSSFAKLQCAAIGTCGVAALSSVERLRQENKKY